MSSTTAPNRTKRPGATAAAVRASSRSRDWLSRLDSPVTTYYLLVCVTAALVIFGLIMVLSASSIVSLGTTSSAYSIFLSQLLFAVIGTVALVVASRIPVSGWKKLALPILVVAVVLQLLVFTPLGVAVQGNRNWIRVGPITVQPSELIKLGLVLSGGLILGAKRKHLSSFTHVLIPWLVPLVAVAVAAVAIGHDLGTVMILGAIVTSPNRLGRFNVWLGRDTNEFGAARQPIHGRYALADGGWFGLGLGASREKWGLLSEPHNDFIFAIIGEELGLPGTIAVLVLFAGLALACYRLVTRSSDFFTRPQV